MHWTVHAAGNTVAALWLALAVLGAMLKRGHRSEKRVHDGTGLVLWGSYLVALLALNLHEPPFGTLSVTVRYACIAIACAVTLTRLGLIVRRGAQSAWGCRIAPVLSAVFCVALTAGSGDIVALVTVLVASSAATAVAVSHNAAAHWDAGSP
jgi:hypothetical protein